jgi:hypothetical protein
MSGECVGHPFDLTKTRLQTAAPGSYTGAIDVVKKTLARDGVKGYVLRSSPNPYMVRVRMMILTSPSVVWYSCVVVLWWEQDVPRYGTSSDRSHPDLCYLLLGKCAYALPCLTPHSLAGNLELEPELGLEFELILDLVIDF